MELDLNRSLEKCSRQCVFICQASKSIVRNTGQGIQSNATSWRLHQPQDLAETLLWYSFAHQASSNNITLQLKCLSNPRGFIAIAIELSTMAIVKLPLGPSLLGEYSAFRLTVILLASLVGFIVVTHLYTHIRYRLSISSFRSLQQGTLQPPHIPYTVPFLGSAIAFLEPKSGAYWRSLFSFHPRSTGACTLLLGGKTNHVLFSPQAVLALFKAKGTSRQVLNSQIMINALGLTQEENAKYYGLNVPHEKGKLHPTELTEKINHDTLLKTDAVNELTDKFIDEFQKRLDTVSLDGEPTDLFLWLRKLMCHASMEAFFGSRILEIYPDIEEDFFDWDRHMLSLFFGLPWFFIPSAHRSQRRILAGLEKYNAIADEETKGTPVDSYGDVAWEPIYGGRGNRARQEIYRAVGLSMRGRAGLDLGFMFALNSNAIPATG
jgi:hypothetical protein